MDNGASKLSASKGAFKWVAVGAAFAILAPTAVQAASQAVRVTNEPTIEKINKPVTVKGSVKVGSPKVKLTDTAGGRTNADAISPIGLFDAPGSAGALDVSVFSGGGGVLGFGDCDPAAPQAGATWTVEPNPNDPVIVTGIILTGSATKAGPPDAQLTIMSNAVGPIPLVGLTVDETTPNAVFTHPYGLTLTDDMIFTCTAEAGAGAGDGQWIVLGQGPQDVPAP